MRQDTTYYWLTALLFTLFFAMFMLTYQQRDLTAEDSIFVEINNNKPECEVYLFADGVVVGTARMDNGNCNISIYKD